jgi:hypothetical protein
MRGGEGESDPNGLLYMLFWWACPLVNLRLEQSHNCVSGRILRLQSRICDSSHKCASSVTTCDPGHMLTLCAWDCTFEHHLWCHSMPIFNMAASDPCEIPWHNSFWLPRCSGLTTAWGYFLWQGQIMPWPTLCQHQSVQWEGWYSDSVCCIQMDLCRRWYPYHVCVYAVCTTGASD